MEQKHKPYIRASARQLEYIARLCDELGLFNGSLYQRTSMIRASKEIARLKKLLAAHQEKQRQQVLF